MEITVGMKGEVCTLVEREDTAKEVGSGDLLVYATPCMVALMEGAACEAIAEAIGDKKGIRRMGHAIVPMDDSVATVAIDISGRSYCNMDLDFKHDKIGDLSSDVVVHFFESFASSGKINIYGTCEGANDHHKAEALFKAFAKSLYDGCKIEHDEILSTKGVL